MDKRTDTFRALSTLLWDVNDARRLQGRPRYQHVRLASRDHLWRLREQIPFDLLFYCETKFGLTDESFMLDGTLISGPDVGASNAAP